MAFHVATHGVGVGCFLFVAFSRKSNVGAAVVAVHKVAMCPAVATIVFLVTLVQLVLLEQLPRFFLSDKISASLPLIC